MGWHQDREGRSSGGHVNLGVHVKIVKAWNGMKGMKCGLIYVFSSKATLRVGNCRPSWEAVRV